MIRPRVGAVTIGQTPRPDLLEPLLERVGADAEIIEVGALDGQDADRLRSRLGRRGRQGSPTYPLTTRLRDGSPVRLDEADLAPLVQEAIDRAENAGAEVTLLLCAGGFLDATGRRPLVRPFDAGSARLRDLGVRRLAVLVPYEGQADPARRKWQAAGFQATALVGDPESIELPTDLAGLDGLVLDYVGHASRVVKALRDRTAAPVVDLGECGADAAVAVIAEHLGHAVVAGR
ncbi:MAG: AroM family protein [Chloroflexota bacterium]